MIGSKNLESRSEMVREWAKAQLIIRRLAGERIDRNPQCGSLPRVKHPAILIQAALQETFRPASPVELFSDEQPQFSRRTAEEENLIPIDDVLGRYNYRRRTIEVFHKNVAHFARSELNCEISSLECIVRVHEYAHALLHIGLSWHDEPSLIQKYPAAQQTDWSVFLKTRSVAFRSLPSDVHEFIAQVISWMVIGVLEPLSERKELQELFVRVMERQPRKYVLGPEILGRALYGDPTLLLAWARDPVRNKPPFRQATREAAEELLRRSWLSW